MKMALNRLTYSLCAALSFAMILTGSAATTIFDNSVNDLSTRFDPGTTQVGDQILLASTERMLTMFSFEYWGVNTANPTAFAGPVEARVRFYDNTGTAFNGYSSPANSFFDSGWFSVNPTERSTLVFAAGVDFPSTGLFIPVNEMTWSVQFQGMGATDTVGLDIYSPPTVGQDYPDYWENDGGWMLKTNTVAVNFAAKMDAIVPEPSSAVLSILGGAALLLAAGRLRRTA
jgi:hypothetical protein